MPVASTPTRDLNTPKDSPPAKEAADSDFPTVSKKKGKKKKYGSRKAPVDTPMWDEPGPSAEKSQEPLPAPWDVDGKPEQKSKEPLPAPWDVEAEPEQNPDLLIGEVEEQPPAEYGAKAYKDEPKFLAQEQVAKPKFSWGGKMYEEAEEDVKKEVEEAKEEAKEDVKDEFHPDSPLKPSPVHSQAAWSPWQASSKPAAAAVSPPYRPSSLHQAQQPLGVIGGYRTSSSAAGPPNQPRRSSLAAPQQTSPRPRFAQVSPQPRFIDPPPPHMPQTHFYGVPDIGLNLTQQTEEGRVAGSDGLCCYFGSFADAGDPMTAKKARDALLLGSEDGLEVYRVLPDKMEVVGRLEGLRGAVVEAKILPHTDRYDLLQDIRPLVAVIVHGPAATDRINSDPNDESVQDHSKLYQTTVEVYSLRTQDRIATLFESNTVPMEQHVAGHLPRPPPPVGELRIDAAGSFVTVASGKSGEVFVFSNAPQHEGDAPQFRCIGKLWTSLQQRQDTSRPASAAETTNPSTESLKRPRVPLLSLSGRWLCLVPPYTPAGMPIQGSPLLLEGSAPPVGISTITAPPQPAVSCEVAGIDAEGTLSWLSRKAAQGLVKASQKGFEMGWQGWKELTHPSPPSAQQPHQRSMSQELNMFPPTNAPAEDPKRLAKEPALVSIIDLQRLQSADQQKSKQAPIPLATFALVEGCNHMSFSPDGLHLLTSNRRGEVSTVWDLTHIAHGSGKTEAGDDDMEHAPHIMQLHRIARSSPSVIVDSAWSRDGDWLAMLTTHGTVHLHEVQLTTPSRKRKRRNTVVAAAPPEKAEATVGMSQGMSPPSSNGLLGSFRSWSQSVTTQASVLKTQYALPTTFAGFRETAAAAGNASRKAVARGLGQGYSAAKSGASDIWHAEDNKIRMKTLRENSGAGCLMWMQRQSDVAVAVIGGSHISLSSVERVTRYKGDMMVSGLKREKYPKNFPLPRFDKASAKGNGCSEQGPHGFWSLQYVPTGDPPKARKRSKTPSLAAANEVETNPPYCPFHVDRRVGVYAFDDTGNSSQTGEDVLFNFKIRGHAYFENEGPWVFGEPLPLSTKMNERAQQSDVSSDSDGYDADDIAAQVESGLFIEPAGQGREEQIHVNSRRSRRGRRAAPHRAEIGSLDVMDEDEL